MTRAEFIQRASMHENVRVYGTEHAVEIAVKLADQVAKVAPFDERSVTDVLEWIDKDLEGIEKSLDCIANELPHAGRGT